MPLLLSGARATEEAARFVGAFELVSYERVDRAALAPAYTEGMMLYDASGRVSVHLLTAGDAQEDDRDASSPGHVAYYGDYDVNVFQGVVRHNIEHASGPGLRGTTLTHQFEFAADDTLMLSEVGDDGVLTRATWQRHR